MKHDPINHSLLEEFPYLKENYEKVKDGVFDLDTPSTSFYEEIFVPYIIKNINENNKEEVNHCFDFVEKMMNDEDETVQDVAIQSVLCVLGEKKIDLKKLPLGKRSLEYVKDWVEI